MNNEPLNGGRIAAAAGVGAVAGAAGGAAANRIERAAQDAGFRRATTADVAAPNRPGAYTTNGNSAPIPTNVINATQAGATAVARTAVCQVGEPCS